MGKRIVAVIALMLAGCAPTPIILPDGHQGYSVDCSGLCCNIGDCMNKAAKVCGGPYRILTAGSESSGGMLVPAGTGAVMVSGMQRTMIVECGAAQ